MKLLSGFDEMKCCLTAKISGQKIKSGNGPFQDKVEHFEGYTGGKSFGDHSSQGFTDVSFSVAKS